MAYRELWKPVPGHKGYEVSDLGQVRSLDRLVLYKDGRSRLHRGRILRQFSLWNGYRTTHLGAKHMNKYVHHLVARAFMGETPKGMEICHNNGDKLDNSLINLRFDTRINNMADCLKHGTHARGTRSSSAKLTEQQVREIRTSDLTPYTLAKKYGLHRTTVVDIILKRRWAWLDAEDTGES